MKLINSNSTLRQRNWYESLFPILVCGLCIGQVWAQEAGKRPAPPQMQVAVVSSANDPAYPVQAASKKAGDDSFVIGPDDVLAVSVWKEPDISRSIPVRSDGKITLPLVGELQAGDRLPANCRRRSRPGFGTSSQSPKSRSWCRRYEVSASTFLAKSQNRVRI